MLPAAKRSRGKWLALLTVLGVLLAAPAAWGVPRPVESGASRVAQNYLERFYPRWFSYQQTRTADLHTPGGNVLFGPDRVTPLYGAVVAINVDTLYASAIVEPGSEPVVFTIPETSASYSLFTATNFGDVFDSGIPSGQPGTYALTAPDWRGELPAGITRVDVPYRQSMLIIRGDKYSGGRNTVAEAESFRRNLRMATLSDYLANPDAGKTEIVPGATFAIRYKVIADSLVARTPIAFLRQLQAAVHDPRTAPLSGGEKAVAAEFDRVFGNGRNLSLTLRHQLAHGARQGHARITENYLDHTTETNWVNFRNIGDWTADDYLDRSAVAEFLQWGNSLPTAAYWHAFKDASGTVLDGGSQAYVVTFPPGELPETSRFWSLTAYTPNAVTLIPNSSRTYAVASYTPEMKRNPDGSLSIHLSRTRPAGVNPANWIPVGNGEFNVMLRAYGPRGGALDGSYVPPGITPLTGP